MFFIYFTASSSLRSSLNLSCTFWTVLSGSKAISGTDASTINEKRFSIRFAYLLKCKKAEKHSFRNSE
uniref:Uncharacterized protein n=1 Tax=Lepeophtheirus salmonis TaxID=72036 RepID=A0A0K2U3I7_LEPSM